MARHLTICLFGTVPMRLPGVRDAHMPTGAVDLRVVSVLTHWKRPTDYISLIGVGDQSVDLQLRRGIALGADSASRVPNLSTSSEGVLALADALAEQLRQVGSRNIVASTARLDTDAHVLWSAVASLLGWEVVPPGESERILRARAQGQSSDDQLEGRVMLVDPSNMDTRTPSFMELLRGQQAPIDVRGTRQQLRKDPVPSAWLTPTGRRSRPVLIDGPNAATDLLTLLRGAVRAPG